MVRVVFELPQPIVSWEFKMEARKRFSVENVLQQVLDEKGSDAYTIAIKRN